ncbi:cysteine hydrolase [Duganella sp. LX47W]|uniref:Cysteine hydrolase n=2 Tax=Rugamonas apoptosis TaxID=2758570 RepID=A0A7W2FB87_9BURK|nr:cysteine hydrolase family protein [Rugamonas apoptosis]MBA5688567.1 cysteine hydrolase [Rugamonas apoptosis]
MTATLRSIAAIQPVEQLAAASTAVLLIDFQNEYYRGRVPIPDGLPALRNANRLAALADAHGMPVFHIQHVNGPTAPVFAAGSVMAEIHPQLAVRPQHVVVRKDRVSSFAGTDLHAQLQARGIRTLIIGGLMTHMCVSTATRDARQFGAQSYQVLVAADACASRDITGWNGGVTSAQDLHDVTLTALSDNFAQVLTTNAILELSVTA